jgi:hypothetical protein
VVGVDNWTVLAILFFAVVALLLGGLGVYFLGGGPYLAEWWGNFKEWWERTKANEAARAAQRQEMYAREQHERELGIEVGLPPSAVLDRAVEAMTRSGYGLEARTDTAATFARHQGANIGLGIFLILFCCILPGVLYLLLAERTVRVTIAAYSIEGGSRVVVGGDKDQDVSQATSWARGLPEPIDGEASPAPLQQQAREPPETQSPTVAPDIPEQIRRLAELRDAGLITQEEFETKKSELLRRM